jgi:GNAT superfamily N-acetyltransferase
MLDIGHHDVPRGCLAAVVTTLEMRTPAPRPQRSGSPWTLDHWPRPALDSYRGLYRRVGTDWLWSSRLALSDEALAAIVHDAGVHVYALAAPRGTGMLELDFRRTGECELAFFGLSAELIGGGAGRWLMNRAVELAWSRPIGRFWVHTCTLDHPGALAFYRRSGFTPVGTQVEIMADPRLAGLLPGDAAPQWPVLPG